MLDRPYRVSGSAAHTAVSVSSLLLVPSQGRHCWERTLESLCSACARSQLSEAAQAEAGTGQCCQTFPAAFFLFPLFL